MWVNYFPSYVYLYILNYLERVSQFSYLGYKLSFMEKFDISDKITKFNKSVGINGKKDLEKNIWTSKR